MANRLTRVPDGPVPALGRAAFLLPVADAFMILMVSRPATGSLRQTWVTPATQWLCSASATGSVPIMVGLATGGRSVLAVAAMLITLTLFVGSAAVAIVGACQRLRGARDT